MERSGMRLDSLATAVLPPDAVRTTFDDGLVIEGQSGLEWRAASSGLGVFKPAIGTRPGWHGMAVRVLVRVLYCTVYCTVPCTVRST